MGRLSKICLLTVGEKDKDSLIKRLKKCPMCFFIAKPKSDIYDLIVRLDFENEAHADFFVKRCIKAKRIHVTDFEVIHGEQLKNNFANRGKIAACGKLCEKCPDFEKCPKCPTTVFCEEKLETIKA